jgi:hypothetical protein
MAAGVVISEETQQTHAGKRRRRNEISPTFTPVGAFSSMRYLRFLKSAVEALSKKIDQASKDRIAGDAVLAEKIVELLP